MRGFLSFTTCLAGLTVLLPAQTPAPKPAATAPKPAAAAATKPAATTAKPATAGKPPVTAKKPEPPAPKPMTDEEKVIYSLGLSVQRSLGPFDLSPAEVEIVKTAISDAAAGKPAIDLQTFGPMIQGLQTARAARGREKQKALSAAFLSRATVEAGADKTASGLVYREVRAGAGESPKATDTVKVNYRGTLVDGTEFDSSYKRGEPAQFPLNGVIKCWTEGVQKMKPGGKSLLICPSDIAYGDEGRPGIPGGAALVFEIELLEVVGSSAAK